MSEGAPPCLLLLGRPDCPLCEDFEQALRAHAAPESIELMYADVDSNDDWKRRYGLRIPVLLDAWNEVICEAHFDTDAFDQCLQEWRRRAAR